MHDLWLGIHRIDNGTAIAGTQSGFDRPGFRRTDLKGQIDHAPDGAHRLRHQFRLVHPGRSDIHIQNISPSSGLLHRPVLYRIKIPLQKCALKSFLIRRIDAHTDDLYTRKLRHMAGGTDTLTFGWPLRFLYRRKLGKALNELRGGIQPAPEC